MFKQLLIFSYATLLFCGLAFTGVAQTITSVLVTDTSPAVPAGGYCPRQQIRVSFTATGFLGPTTFSVHLSDGTGFFPATPNVIGTGTASPIIATLPAGAVAGTGYQVKVVSGTTVSAASSVFRINPIATVSAISNITPCNGSVVGGIVFSSSSAGATFTWTSTANVGFGTSGSGNIPSFTATGIGTTATVTVTPSVNGCTGTPTTFTVSVQSGPSVNAISNVNLCNGAGSAGINFSSPTPGTTFTWTSNTNVGFGTSGSGAIPAFTAANGGTSPLSATVTVTPTNGGCTGTSSTFTVVVNPTATVNTLSNASFCGGIPVAGTSFSSPSSGASFNWTSSTNVGFGTSGSGNIGGYTTINSNTTQIVSTINVTPSVGGCTGTLRSFTITVNPTPTVNSVSNAVYCNANPGAAIAFSGPVAGTTFSWTGSANVGFGVTGSGNINAYTATNTGANPLISSLSVTPTTGTCTGPATGFTVTVNPTPSVAAITDAAFCGNVIAPAINFSSAASGTTFAWTSSSNVGFGTSGSGNITAYTTVDSDAATVGTVTVIPTANTCIGTSRAFTVTVNPSPKVNIVGNAVFCTAAAAPAISFSSPTTGTTYTWSASSNVGFGTAGLGNIAAYTATNAGAAPVISTINVTPKTATCTGPVRSFTVTVNPTPVVSPVTNITYCGAATGAPINFSSPTSGTTFTWASTGNVGFGTSGSGNIAGYTVTNPITTTSTASITVNPTANSCAGPASTFTITVNPTPSANAISNVTLCAGATGSPITFSSDTPNTNFNWSTPTNVGFGVAGSGNIGGGFSALNNSQNVLTATVRVIPATATCTGTARVFTFVVNPTPRNPGATTPIFYCNTAIPQPLSAIGENLKWYNEPTGGTGSGVAPSPSTGNVGTTSFYVTQTNQFNCESPRTEVKVTIRPLPPTANVPKQEYLLCQFDQPVKLDAQLAGTGQSLVWILPNNNETGEAPTITTDAGFVGSYSVLQVLDGCRGVRTEIKVNVRTTPPPAVSTVPVVSCQNSPPQPLEATGTNLKWYNTNRTGGTPQATPNIPPTQTPGTYLFYVTQTGTNTCESPRSEITVVIQPLPSATLTGGGNITQGQPTNLTIAFTGQGPWTYTLSNGLTLTATQNPVTIQAYPLETTVYNITKITNNCGEGTPAGSASVQVKIATIDVGNPSATTICASQSFTIPYFSSDFFPSSTQFRVQISKSTDDAGFQTIPTEGNNSPIRATLPNATSGGTYYVRVVGLASVAGNSFTIRGKLSPVQINVRELPTATLSGPTRVYENESAKLAIAFTGETPWRITYRDSLAAKDTTFTTSATPYEFSVRPGKTNTYSVVSISNGCGNGPATSKFVLIVDPVLGVEPALSSEWLKVYPVPVQARCTIEIDGTGGKAVSFTVTDGLGRIILRQQTFSNKDEMDLSQLAPGMYFLNAEREGQIARRKILKVQ